MPDSGGYWLNLAEAQKLTQPILVPGIIEEDIRRGGIVTMLPITQSPGQSLDFNREVTIRTPSKLATGGQLTWTDNQTLEKRTVELKQMYDQTPLNKFVTSVYGTMNNYRAITLRGMRKGMVYELENRVIYDDLTFGSTDPNGGALEFDGLHAICAENTGDLNIDQAEGGLAISNLRAMVDAMKYGIDFFLMPYAVARRLDAFYQEVGSTISGRSAVGSYFWSSLESIGMRIPFWNSIPIIRTDFLVAEQANTGAGSDARAVHTSGDEQFSVLGVKMGQVSEDEPGLTLLFGGDDNELGEFFRLEVFDKLENFDAAGFRMIAYTGLANASSLTVARIFDIENVAVVE